jgi:hypothetical protein
VAQVERGETAADQPPLGRERLLTDTKLWTRGAIVGEQRIHAGKPGAIEQP